MKKKIINSLLSIFEYKGTSLYTNRDIYNIIKYKHNKLLKAKMLWDNMPPKGGTTIFIRRNVVIF